MDFDSVFDPHAPFTWNIFLMPLTPLIVSCHRRCAQLSICGHIPASSGAKIPYVVHGVSRIRCALDDVKTVVFLLVLEKCSTLQIMRTLNRWAVAFMQCNCISFESRSDAAPIRWSFGRASCALCCREWCERFKCRTANNRCRMFMHKQHIPEWLCVGKRCKRLNVHTYLSMSGAAILSNLDSFAMEICKSCGVAIQMRFCAFLLARPIRPLLLQQSTDWIVFHNSITFRDLSLRI